MSHGVKLLFCIVAGLSLSLPSSTLMASSASQSLVDVPVPFGTTMKSVGVDVVHNGQSMAVATYESSLSLADTVAFYQQLWIGEPDKALPGLVENRVGEWLMLGRLQDGFQTVLQLRLTDTHKSTGYLSVMSIESGSSGNQPGLPLPGLERLSTTRSQDAGRSSVLSVFSSRESVDSLARQLAGHWQGRGWTLVSNEAYAQSKVLLLNRDSAQLEIVVSGDTRDTTIVVMNEVDDHD